MPNFPFLSPHLHHYSKVLTTLFPYLCVLLSLSASSSFECNTATSRLPRFDKNIASLNQIRTRRSHSIMSSSPSHANAAAIKETVPPPSAPPLSASVAKKAARKAAKAETKAARRAVRAGEAPASHGRKPCDLCARAVDLLIRCQLDGRGDWRMVCGRCWKLPSVANGVPDGDGTNPHYRYGGLWKNLHAPLRAPAPPLADTQVQYAPEPEVATVEDV